MNYEELLNQQNLSQSQAKTIAFGVYKRKIVGNKYRNVVEIRKDLADSLVFTEALKADCEFSNGISAKSQLHYAIDEEIFRVLTLNLEPGNFQTLASLIDEKPAVVATAGFIDNILSDLSEVLEALHQKGEYAVCLSPDNVFVRKGDGRALVFLHGSLFLPFKEQRLLYADDQSFVAPEVLDENRADERSDVYSLGRLLEWLSTHMELSTAYRKAIARAIAEAPEERYSSVDTMIKDIRAKRSLRRSLIAVAAAVVLSLVGVGLYFELMPKSETLDFVKKNTDDPFAVKLDDTFDNALEKAYEKLDSITDDPAMRDSVELRATPEYMKAYQAKAEQIFIKRYTKEVERVLGKIYNSDYMSAPEKKFNAASTATMRELASIKNRLGDEAGLSAERADEISADIIDKVGERMLEGQVKTYGVQK